MDETTRQVVELKESGKTWREICDKTGLKKETARSKYRNYIAKQADEAPAPNPGCIVIGAMPDDYEVDVQAAWKFVIEQQVTQLKKLSDRRYRQRIEIPAPCSLAFLSDLHFGDAMTDYKAAKHDAEIVRDTPGMFAGFHGDAVNNWIVGKLQALERGEVVNFDTEWALFFDWVEMLGQKLAFVCSGNHDNWTIAAAGFDRIRDALKGCRVLYHTQQIVFTLVVGGTEYVIKIRHKWRGLSIFNVTHGIETSWERGGDNFDIGVGGHTHIGTYCRPFTRHNKRRWAVLTGTYKVGDEYGDQLGHAPPQNTGCGAFVFDKNGEVFGFYDDLEKAAFVLGALQNE